MTQPVKHTPGPWHVGLKPGPMVYGPQGEQIVGLNVLLDSNEVLANAKFIAAAPAMYEALKHAAMSHHHPACKAKGEYTAQPERYCSCHVQKARAALAQAEGK